MNTAMNTELSRTNRYMYPRGDYVLKFAPVSPEHLKYSKERENILMTICNMKDLNEYSEALLLLGFRTLHAVSHFILRMPEAREEKA